MTEDEALAHARQMFGPRAYAMEQRAFTGHEKPGPDGWVQPAGAIYAYAVGYCRTGKRGATLYTRKGHGTSFEAALAEADAALTPAQRLAYHKRRSC